MKHKLLHIIQKPLFLVLLPLFFFLHALLENYNPVLIKTAAWLTLFYSSITIALAGSLYFLFKDWRKAAFLAFMLMAFNLFFGSGYDLLKKNFADSFITKFSFICIVSFILLVTLVIYLKRSRRTLLRTTRYLNLLFLLLVLFDAGSLLARHFKLKKDHVADLSPGLLPCDSCARPDIYFIITDEYAGRTELEDLFSFDNSAFENELRSRGYHIISNSVSNYNATVYSLASLLNMDYIHNLEKPSKVNHRDMLLCKGLINNNTLTSFLLKKGYSIYNNSFFDLAGRKKVFRNLFFSTNRSLLTHQTFVNRFLFHFGARFASDQKIIDIKKNNLYSDIKIDSLARKAVVEKDPDPKFVYTHLKMPHHPYFFDSAGNEIPVQQLSDAFSMDRKAYTQYLQYSNKKLLGFIDFIKQNAGRPAIIILMSDHGFRQLAPDVDKKYHFMNLNAVYFPDSSYAGFYNGMSNVNQFRVTLNTLFGQKLPLLKDSTSFLSE